MKLRSSFVSIKAIADDLNVPLSPDTVSLASSKNSVDINIKIDKPTKSTGLRVRNLKKSMLNDTRLLKLKEKFIKRSKSTACDSKTIEQQSNEVNQNKENEHPKSPSMVDISVKSPGVTRNKVKMGTRVFSASYLNKSFDSLCENQLEICRFDSWGALCPKTQLSYSQSVQQSRDSSSCDLSGNRELKNVSVHRSAGDLNMKDEKLKEFCMEVGGEAFVIGE